MIEVELQIREALDAAEIADGVEEAPWDPKPRTHAEALRADFDDLDPDQLYDVRVRYVRDDIEGEWATRLAVAVPAAASVDDEATRPDPPQSIRHTSNGCLTWSLPDVGQIEGVELRTVPGIGSSDDWDAAEPAQSALVKSAPMPLCTVPGGQRTALLRTIDRDGLESEIVAYTFKTREMDDGLAVELILIDEETLGFPGDLQGGASTGDGLDQILVTGIADDMPWWRGDLAVYWNGDDTGPYWRDDDVPFYPRASIAGDAFRFWQGDDAAGFYGSAFQALAYQWGINLESKYAGPDRRLSVDIDATSPNGPWRLRFRAPGQSIPFWTPYAGTPWWTDDAAPFWGEGNEQWELWPGQLDAPFAGEYLFQLEIPAGGANGRVETIRVRATEELSVASLQAASSDPAPTYIAQDYFVQPGDSVLVIDASTRSVTISLASAAPGDKITLLRVDASANVVTISGAGGDTINGLASQTMDSQYDTWTLLFAVGNWFVA